mgnify:CR=1 FL=1
MDYYWRCGCGCIWQGSLENHYCGIDDIQIVYIWNCLKCDGIWIGKHDEHLCEKIRIYAHKINRKKCLSCDNIPNYGYEKGGASHCIFHKTTSMVNIKNYCTVKHCGKVYQRSISNLRYCAEHDFI